MRPGPPQLEQHRSVRRHRSSRDVVADPSAGRAGSPYRAGRQRCSAIGAADTLVPVVPVVLVVLVVPVVVVVVVATDRGWRVRVSVRVAGTMNRRMRRTAPAGRGLTPRPATGWQWAVWASAASPSPVGDPGVARRSHGSREGVRRILRGQGARAGRGR